MKKLVFISLAITTILLSSCKDKVVVLPEEVVSAEIPSDFLDFYMKFHSDSLYQINHIVFPLKEQSDGQAWTREGWVMHKPFDSHDGQFQRQFLSVKSLVLETITSGNGMYTIEKRYKKASDGYELIYYSIVNAFENSDDWAQ